MQNSWKIAFQNKGWHTRCQSSKRPKNWEIPIEILIGDLDGWEQAGNDWRNPKPGYQYGLFETSTSKGFMGSAEKTYFSVFRRKIND